MKASDISDVMRLVCKDVKEYLKGTDDERRNNGNRKKKKKK